MEGAELTVASDRKQRWLSIALGATLLAILALAAPIGMTPAGARGAGRHRQARAARVLVATDIAHLRFVSASGSLLLEEGPASGTLPGSMRVHFNVGPTFSGSFTIYSRGGTIRGHGTATPHGAGVYESFVGSLVATGGTGRYTHAHGQAGLYGTFNRNTYALTVQTTGKLSY